MRNFENINVEELPKLDFIQIFKDIPEKDVDVIYKEIITEILSSFEDIKKTEFCFPYNYDHSGELIETDESFDLMDNFKVFITERYTGEWIATHTSGCGKIWVTLESEIDDLIRDKSFDYVNNIVKNEICLKLNITNEEKENTATDLIFDYCNEYEGEIYDVIRFPLENSVSSKIEELYDKTIKEVMEKFNY